MMNIPTISFRVCIEEDAAEIVSLVNSAYASDTTTQAWSGTERMPIVSITDLIEKKFSPVTTTVLLAFDEVAGTILAICCVSLLDESRGYPLLKDRGIGPTVWFDSFAVLPVMHRTGLGGKMLSYAEEWSTREFIAKTFMLDTVSSRIQLIAWYRRRGYVPTGETKAFEYKDDAARRTFQPGLEFVVLRRDVGGPI